MVKVVSVGVPIAAPLTVAVAFAATVVEFCFTSIAGADTTEAGVAVALTENENVFVALLAITT
jgi:hypothetical protein